jgi:iron only hydrogenase large subunit-like protein
MVLAVHSVELDRDKCIGCTDCIKRCPTEAIRVRNGKAVIIGEKCIDCGLCIKVCAQRAKKATTQKMSIIKSYPYKVALPAPSLYAQFKNLSNVNVILTVLKRLGFDDIMEVASAAQMVTEVTKRYISENKGAVKPLVSSACPAVVRLIGMRFPSLIGNILPVIAPVEACAAATREYAMGLGIPREDIGIFFISPCAAKCTYAVAPLGLEGSEIDGVISMQDIFMSMRNGISGLTEIEKLAQSGPKGVDWAMSGGESKGVEIENAIAVDGVENVIQVLEEVENGQLQDVEFIEGLACTGGCIGGPLTVVNSFVARNRLRRLQRAMGAMPPQEKRPPVLSFDRVNFFMTQAITPVPAAKLDEDMGAALHKMEEMEKIYAQLPCIDCGSCGSPTCRTFAEDIVRGDAIVEDCIFMLRQRVRHLAEEMLDLSAKLPQTFTDRQ